MRRPVGTVSLRLEAVLRFGLALTRSSGRSRRNGAGTMVAPPEAPWLGLWPTSSRNPSKECSHYVELVSTPGQLPQILERAIRTAIRQRVVAVVVIPAEVKLQPTKAAVPRWLVPSRSIVRPSDADLDRLAGLLNDAGRVTLLC